MDVEKTLQKIAGLFSAGRKASPETVAVNLALLRAMMMLAAVDGVITKDELSCFWRRVRQCEGVDAETLEQTWRSALSSAGLLAMQSMLLSREGLVAEFLREIEGDFVQKLLAVDSSARKDAYRCLQAVAEADGDCQEIERACISALVARVRDAWESKVVSEAE